MKIKTYRDSGISLLINDKYLMNYNDGIIYNIINKNKKIPKGIQQFFNIIMNINIKTNNELKENKKMLEYFRSKKKTLELIENAKKECTQKQDINRIKLVEKTYKNFNYRDIITKTASGKICIDIQQIPLTDEEIKKELEKTREDN